MTAIATILATLPLAIGANDGSFISAELGTVVIGGLLSSTLLTLVVIPVLYSLASDLKRRLGFHPSYPDDEDFEVVVPSSAGALSGEGPHADAVQTH
jgi:hypothetical protein